MDAITLSLIIIAIINAALGFLLLSDRNKYHASSVYAINVVMILSWVGGILFYRWSNQEDIVNWTKALYTSATLIASSFLYFTYIFPEREGYFSWTKKVLFALPNIIVAALVIWTDKIIAGATVMVEEENKISFGTYYPLYILYILSYFMFGFYRLTMKYRRITDKSQKQQIIFVLIGYIISANISFITNLLLPWFGIFNFNWLGQVSTVTMIAFATYAIIEHQLFNIKAVATELLIGVLWIFLLIRTILAADATERFLNGGMFIVSIILGYFLIRSVKSEIAQREKIENLAKELEDTNIHLQELDQQKSEFVSLASHQLRGPLTAVRGYASMLLDGDFGTVQPEAKDAIDKIFTSTKDLLVVVEDYLNVSRIEQGRMQYDYSVFDLRELAATVVTELRPNIERAHLKIDYDYDMHGDYRVNADIGKIKQVISNLIDNAIKYTPTGSIHVWLTHGSKETITANPVSNSIQNSAQVMDMRRILLCISDTGVGILPEVLPRLFEKFTRAPDASKTNIMGTGLGLYVARKMIEAHGGKIWAESAGAGKGSTFFIELKCIE